MIWVIGIFALLMTALVASVTLRFVDRQNDNKVWCELIRISALSKDRFDPSLVSDLPEPAQRYFLYTIAPGTPLRTVVEINMIGKLGLGTKSAPNYKPMSARQILAPPHGLVWTLKTKAIVGSDGATPLTSWTRFYLFGFIPIVRAGGNNDHHRSAFGRVVAEAAFWAPASLLPQDGVKWEAGDADTARVMITYHDCKQAVDITVGKNGKPIKVIIQRWSNENPAKRFREQPFGGELSAFRDFSGYRLPTHVEGGNHFGTDKYFPFYKVDVTDIQFPHSSDGCD